MPWPNESDQQRELRREARRVRLELDQLAADQLAGGYRSAHHGAGVEFDEVREYVPGDDPRAVDWNVTARVGKPFIKKYVDERERCIFVLFDCGASMRAGLGDWSLADVTARLCAIWARATERFDDPIGWLAYAETVRRVVPPRKGVRHASALLSDALSFASAAHDNAVVGAAGSAGNSASDLAGALQRALSLLTRKCTLMVISDFVTELPIQLLARAARHHDVVLHGLRGAEWQRPPQVPVHTSGGTQTVRLAGEEWRRSLEDWCEQREASLSGTGCELLWIDLPWHADIQALARPIQHHFRQRKSRRRRRS